jgi:hypothetical protein
MRRLGAVALVAAAGGLLGCGALGGRPRREPPPPPALQIWAPPIVRWAPGGERDLAFALENGTHRTLEVSPPDPAGARVAIFAGAGETRECGIEPAERAAAGPVAPAGRGGAGALRLAPGDQLPVRVDLEDACAGLGPGEYRYELGYVAARPQGGSLSLPTRYGTLVVTGAARAARRPAASVPRPEPRPR